ncbi:hypothetical protein WN944_023612 [Citrus x changshan-huyou]|uniref:Uncharacterized protein n=1 Tax=Citrus x changshan-huyou TaxID=2935761 RepID=A0AAP0R1D0_9ROSI
MILLSSTALCFILGILTIYGFKINILNINLQGKFYFFHPADFSATSPRLLLADLFVVRKNTLIGRKTWAMKNK